MNGVVQAAADGYGCLVSWSDLLDRINVFPVADGDTGANLRISLAPLQRKTSQTVLPSLLARSACGNSGNIAAAFLQEFLQAEDNRDIAARTVSGRDKAHSAVLDPRRGTMLDIFDVLAETLSSQPLDTENFPVLSGRMQSTVLATCTLLPELKNAGVVDSGALAMFIFLQGFFKTITSFPDATPSILQLFPDKLALSSAWSPPLSSSHCIDARLSTTADVTTKTNQELTALGESVVISQDTAGVKLHIHTQTPEQVREFLNSMGKVIQWKDEDMTDQQYAPTAPDNRPVHIMTDAAGSLDRTAAQKHNITLLDSYIITKDQVCPESLCSPAQIYEQMRQGARVSTAQASTFERQQQYTAAIQQHDTILYLCVGSVYTGNFAAATEWKNTFDSQDQLHIVDSGAASGRLALITLQTARFADSADNAGDVVAYARQQCLDCYEYVFINELKYLVAGGRISKAKGFFGDLLHKKPVISPLAHGVEHMGMTRSKSEQLLFALDKLTSEASPQPLILLQYSDNRQWVRENVLPAISSLLPDAKILIIPLSLTSGVHMGPGTWAVAFSGEQ